MVFSIGKEERAGTDDIANPAFNISSTDLSAYHTSQEEVIIGRDMLDSTLAAQQQKIRLQAQAEPRGETSLLIIIGLSDSAYVLDVTCAFQVYTRHSILMHSNRLPWKPGMLKLKGQKDLLKTSDIKYLKSFAFPFLSLHSIHNISGNELCYGEMHS